LSAGNLNAANRAERQRASADLVSSALASELAGENDRRMTKLGEALENTPDYAPALWHAGYVHSGKKWLKIDELARQQADDQRLAHYRLARDRQPDTVDGNLEMARWCAAKKMPDQRRAHLTRVVALAPNHAEARRALGHQLVDGQWRSQAELELTRERVTREAANLERWRSKMETLRDRLTHDNRRLREAAQAELKAIKDPTAAPAMEVVLAGHSEELAKLALDVLNAMPAAEASLSIMRIALTSPWQATRDLAATKLAGRDKHHYVPYLLAGLEAPVRSQAALFASPNGQVFYRHIFYREGQEQTELGMVDTGYPLTAISEGTPREQQAARQQLFASRVNDAIGRARTRELQVAQQNAVIGASNERLNDLLKKVSGQTERTSIDDWSSWWDEHNEVVRSKEKPVYVAYGYSQRRFEDPLKFVPRFRRRNEPTANNQPQGEESGVRSVPPGATTPGPVPRGIDCFVAGTPVWTETGLKPIEEVRVGDRVLAQDIATGELTLKPVVATTERPPEKTVEVQIGGQTLRCTGGHPFWVAGRGWQKARLLEAGQGIHGVEGATNVGKVTEAPPAATYNFEVADFNNYFVGPDKLLTHDVTSRQPTAAALPGLLQQ
jgi:hypothetical protein